MVYNTPFHIKFQGTGTSTPMGCGIMAFVANSIGIGSIQGTSALATLPIEGYAHGVDFIMATNGVANLVFNKENATPGILSNNYMHMGNLYKQYRVLSVKCRVSGMSLLNSSANTNPSWASPAIWNSFCTDDKEVIDSLAERDNFCRPFIRMNRNTRTHTFMGQYQPPSSMVHKFSPLRLVQDRSAVTSGQYDGTCTPSANIGVDFPVYNPPAKETYHAFNYGMYGFHSNQASNFSFPSDWRLFAGYLTCTKTVKFFSPHANQDFYGAI